MQAGDMWAAGEEYARAVPLYLRTQTDVGLEKAIAVVEKVSVIAGLLCADLHESLWSCCMLEHGT
jgi:hypothetical protein